MFLTNSLIRPKAHLPAPGRPGARGSPLPSRAPPCAGGPEPRRALLGNFATGWDSGGGGGRGDPPCLCGAAPRTWCGSHSCAGRRFRRGGGGDSAAAPRAMERRARSPRGLWLLLLLLSPGPGRQEPGGLGAGRGSGPAGSRGALPTSLAPRRPLEPRAGQRGRGGGLRGGSLERRGSAWVSAAASPARDPGEGRILRSSQGRRGGGGFPCARWRAPSRSAAPRRRETAAGASCARGRASVRVCFLHRCRKG